MQLDQNVSDQLYLMVKFQVGIASSNERWKYTKETEATRMLKPLQSNGASLEMKRAGGTRGCRERNVDGEI